MAGPVDSATGMVIELEALDGAVRSVLDQLDFRHLDREIPAFATRPSTAENIIRYLWDELAPRLEGGLRRLKLWETPRNSFEYAGPGA